MFVSVRMQFHNHVL